MFSHNYLVRIMANLSPEAVCALNGMVSIMKDVLEPVSLFSDLGTHSPYWRLSDDCDTLR